LQVISPSGIKVLLPIPEFPATMLLHMVSNVLPTGVTTPIPVTTTRRFPIFAMVSNRTLSFLSSKGRKKEPHNSLRIPVRLFLERLFLVFLDVTDCILNGLNFFSFFIGNFGAELFFKRHNQFNGIQRISAQILSKVGFWGHFSFIDAQLVDDYFFDSFKY